MDVTEMDTSFGDDMKNDKFITLGIESSCDETSVAVLAEEDVLSNIISSQIHIHSAYGGVVPEIASRHHLENINVVLDEALREAEVALDEVDLIAVTNGPGLVGALVVGVATAKALAFSLDIPIVGVNHMHGHMEAAYVEHKELIPPFISLVISGGHTSIVKVEEHYKYKVLGETRDDAAGEAYDKVARVLGLPYPGGPHVDKLAKEGDGSKIPFKRVWLEKGTLDFSFSGIKTAVLNYVNSQKMQGLTINKADVAASFQESIIEVITKKTIDSCLEENLTSLVLAGGVASNSRLRQSLIDGATKAGIRVFIPNPSLCTDNAAMIALAGYHKYKLFGADDIDLDAISNMEISTF